MSNANTIVKNAGVLFLAEVLNRIISFILVVLIARNLGNEGLGKYSFVFAFVGIFSVLSDFGTSTYITREIAKNKSVSKKYLGNVFVFKIFVSLVSVILPIIFIFFSNQESMIKIGVILAGFSMLVYYMASPFKSVVAAYERQGFHAIYNLTERVVALVLGVWVLYSGKGLLPLLIVLVISNVSSWMVLFLLVSKKVIKLEPKFDLFFIKTIILKSSPFWFTTIFMTIYFRIDTVMLSFMKDYAATGLYNAAYKIIDALTFVPFVVITAIYPAMSKFYGKKNQVLSILYKKSFYYMAVLAVPIGIGTTLLADRIIFFVYDKEFAGSVLILKVLIWALVLIFVNYIMGYMLNSIEKQKLFTLTTGISALLNIILNLFLIPIYSYIGAAIATVASELFNFILLHYFTSKQGYQINVLQILIKPIIAAAIMGILVYSMSFLHLFILVPIAVACYFVVLLLLGGIGKEEMDLARKMLSKN